MAEVAVVSLDGHSMREGEEPSLREDEVPGAVARGSPQDNPKKTIAAVTRMLLERLFERVDIARRIVQMARPVGLDRGQPS